MLGGGTAMAAATKRDRTKPAEDAVKHAFPLIEVSGDAYEMG